MKNKSKLKKIREKKAGTATVTKEWLYMNPNSITVAEIENALDGMDGIETETVSYTHLTLPTIA